MWFVNMIYTLVFLSFLLLATPGEEHGAVTWCPGKAAVSPGMSAALLSYLLQDPAGYNGSSAAGLPLSFQDSDRTRVDGERDGCDSL